MLRRLAATRSFTEKRIRLLYENPTSSLTHLPCELSLRSHFPATPVSSSSLDHPALSIHSYGRLKVSHDCLYARHRQARPAEPSAKLYRHSNGPVHCNGGQWLSGCLYRPADTDGDVLLSSLTSLFLIYQVASFTDFQRPAVRDCGQRGAIESQSSRRLRPDRSSCHGVSWESFHNIRLDL